MSLDKITATDVWMRLVNTEYDELPPSQLEEKFKYIYLEETGEIFNGDLKMFHSSESKSVNPEKTGYDGTALLISDGGEEELFIINQGTQSDTPVDWVYNIKGAFLGQTVDQAEAAREFTREAKIHFDVDEDVSVNALGHSLGNQNGTVTGVSDGTFDEIYGINGLQISPYSQFRYDRAFANEVREEFKVVDSQEIYEIPKEDLVKFTKDYFENTGVKIKQVISTDDPLYGITEKGGLVALGEIEYLDTNPELSGIKTIIDDIPDDVLKEFIDLGVVYASADQKGGIAEVLRQTLGVNYDYIKDINSLQSLGQWYLLNQSEVDETLKAIDSNLPPLIDKLNLITDNSEVIFGRLFEEGYITEEQKKIMIDEISKLAQELEYVQNSLTYNVNTDEKGGFLNKLTADGVLGMVIYNLYNAYNDAMKNIKDSGIMDSLASIVDSHSINELLNARTIGNKTYVGKDVIYTSEGVNGGKPIKVNMSAALRFYNEGIVSLENKLQYINNLEKTVYEELTHIFNSRRSKIISGINSIESSPRSYAAMLEEHKYMLMKIKEVRIIETIPRLNISHLDEDIERMKKSVATGRDFVERYRSAILQLFREEENLSKMFDLAREI